jgi:uncharacterized protein (TIGR02246 family)
MHLEVQMSPDEQAIRELIKTWLAASAAGDTGRVLDLMADDVVFLTPGQQPMQGKAAFAASQEALKGLALEAQSEVQEIRVIGDLAWCWTRLAVTVTPPGASPVRRAGHTLSILQKQASGAWEILRDANMLAAAPS